LADYDWHVRRGTAQSLGTLAQVNPELAAKLYEKCLADNDRDVRQDTAKSLGALAQVNPELAAKLYEKGLADYDWHVRRGTAQSLGTLAQVNPELAAKLYEKGLADNNKDVRQSTSQSLGALAQVNPELYFKLCEKGLADNDKDVRKGTAQSLGAYFQNKKPISLSKEEIKALLQMKRDDVAFVLGYLDPEKTKEIIEQMPANESANLSRMAELGKLLRLPKENYERALDDIAFSYPDTQDFSRALSRALKYHDYGEVSNILLQKVQTSPDEKTLVRYLKTLIEIENPKGRTIATNLFTNRDLPKPLRWYLAKKLIAEKHWDPELNSLLKDRLEHNEEQQVDDILTAMIKDLGLTPDKPAYEALEKPGLLLGKTLEERVAELKARREEFAKLSLSELKNKLRDDRLRRLFYLVKGGEYRYTLINDYSYDKFSLVVKKILEQEVDPTKIDEFRNSLKAAGLSKEEQESILASLQEGRFPLPQPKERSFAFEASVELGSEYELAFSRLQEIWSQELKALAITHEEIDKKGGQLPSGIDVALTAAEGKEVQNPKIQRILAFLKCGEKQDYASLKKLAEAVKKELIFSARQRKDKEKIAEIERLNISGLFYTYLAERLPHLKDSFILTEWESHLRETLSVLEAGPIKGKIKNKQFELTFLDKGKDFMRAVRFADGQQCCFNSIHYRVQGDLGAADWIARLNADPLSFILDLKQKDSNIISGFVFGRMGIDPETKRPVVMLNGIYAQESGGAIASNILKLIEDKFAKVIGASSIVIVSKHGGKLIEIPSGYKNVQRKIYAIRALKNNDKVYDDIGTVANGIFDFEGYERQLR
jgi:HEAT repeat protein